MVIEGLEAEDWAEVRDIHAEGIATGDATFDAAPAQTWEEFDARCLSACRLVARDRAGGPVLGWAVLSAVSRRHVYRGVAEVSVYVGAGARGRGVGRALLEALVRCAARAGFWTLQAGIFPENAASLALHARFGFRVVGTRERLGQMPDGRWRDITLLELRLPG